jgi:ribosomal-protein-alanine N-acetyltransferase
MKIETPQLFLELVTPQVVRKLFENKKDEEIISFFGFVLKGFERLKMMNQGGMETHNLSVRYFILIDKASMQSIGECGFHTWNLTHNKAELFYAMHDENSKQKGFMKEAVSHILRYGFTEMKLHRVSALIAKENTASFKILKHYGFSFEGTMREDYVVNSMNEDSDCYSLLKHEWEKLHTLY